MVAGSIALAGTTGSALGARTWQHDIERNANKDLVRTAGDVSGRASETIRRAMDLTISFRGVVTSSDVLTSGEFDHWVEIFDPYLRHPGLLAFGFIANGSSGPSRATPNHCTINLASTGPEAQVPLPVGADLCGPSSALPFELGRATDTGELVMGVLKPTGTNGRQMVLGAAVYGSHLPVNVFDRRRQVTGWVGVLFDGNQLVGRTLAGHPGLWLEISHQVAGHKPEAIGHSGHRPANYTVGRTVVINADGRWIVHVAAPPTGVSAGAQGRAIFLAGTAVSLLLALLVLVLSRSRDRALRLVATRTDQLRHQALHDPLTGLPNRALIMERVEAMLARAREDRSPCAVMFIDLDDFKDINDTVGHGAGDELLRAVARRLGAAVRPDDTVGRLGGDEFVVLLEGDGLAEGADVIAARLLRTLGEPFALDGMHLVHVRASIGVALGTRSTGSELLRDADVALYGAKAAGRNQVVVFEPAMQERLQERLDLEAALRTSVERGELFLVYQPILDLGRMAVTGVEALVRWYHPERGALCPDTFIPLAEQTGLIMPVGRWVLQEACTQAAGWQAAGHPLQVSVNVSARQLDTDDLVGDVAGALTVSGLEPGMLTLEITESALMADTSASLRRISTLKALGVRIAIDDFGTGYSSLAYLQHFPVDQLKIDRSFIAAMDDSPESAALISTLVHLGRALGIETLAEGIEHITQRDRLRAEQCDLGQGYLFARPLPAGDIVPFIDRWIAQAAPAAAEV
jgi:diguanylate cyclase (GGDEF)-like protein